MSKISRFYMYHVVVTPKQDSEIQSFTDMLDNMPTLTTPMKKDGDDFDLNEGIKKRRDIYSGTFCLVQKDELPPRAKLGDQPKDLDLDDDEGLGHYTSFFFDSSNNIILIQLNRNGITAGGVAKYFKVNFKEFIAKVQFNVVINPSEIGKLQQLSEIRRVTLSVAGVQGGGILANDDVVRSVGELRGIADKTNADTITVTLGMGYSPGTLKRNGISTIFRNILRADTHGDVTKLEVTGRESDEEALKVIDFITNKVIIAVTLPKARFFSVNSIDGVIRQAIEKYRVIKPEITTTYKVKNESDE